MVLNVYRVVNQAGVVYGILFIYRFIETVLSSVDSDPLNVWYLSKITVSFMSIVHIHENVLSLISNLLAVYSISLMHRLIKTLLSSEDSHLQNLWYLWFIKTLLSSVDSHTQSLWYLWFIKTLLSSVDSHLQNVWYLSKITATSMSIYPKMSCL